MSTYISEPNKHIEDYLDYYFDGKKNFEYAVLLNGAWGSGKTWFVKQYLEKKEDQGKKICYVSLNGITKTSLIDEAIFKSIHPILGSKGAKLAGQILKGTLKATVKIDLDGDSKSDGSISGGIPKIELPDYLKINDNFILVFDDLERCELKKEEVLGYINYFVEQENIKTLIVSNEEEIKDNDEYSRKKEKLVGATFSYTEDQDLAIESILMEVEDQELQHLLNSNLELIKQRFNQVGYKNLRSFKQTIFAFEKFYKKDYFSPKGDFDNEIFEKLLKAFLILSLENKKGRFDKKIFNFKPDLDEKLNKEPVDKIAEAISGFEGDDAQEFKKKYQMSFNDYIFSKNLWDQILNKNIITDALIEAELYEAYFRLKEDHPVWLKLWHYLNLSDEDFFALVKQAKQSIENSELTDVTDILHTVSMLIFFSEKKLINFSIEPLLDKAINRFKKIVNIDDRYKSISYFDLSEQLGGYGLYARDSDIFKSFLEKIADAYEEKYLEKNSERYSELLELMQTDPYSFYEKLTNQYYDYPILKCFEVEDFLDQLCKINFKNAMSVLDALNYRYKIISQSKIYLQEQDWFEKLIVLTNKKLVKSKGIEKHKIEEKFIPKLSQIKEEAYKG
ncbi:hypothetical protein B9T29_06770 [Acinetobacter sp. ANC 3903]|uniref:P-loop NTPase fold protein n=1 Tax=Acinetobacter sp. ANC 3903 TaxID=1977883 RepID=UPI000A3400D2|nr:P-loop NTPase fold protein [Acinetobacter sp. ANC 3903]OTG62491.1 hypothetical protein B9T29_06770 [Acinetobacter sp. ANC 3903]